MYVKAVVLRAYGHYGAKPHELISMICCCWGVAQKFIKIIMKFCSSMKTSVRLFQDYYIHSASTERNSRHAMIQNWEELP
jgi:hypothetical protein